MAEIQDYKKDVANTRKGCLGGSDGKMLAQIAALGYVPKSAFKRLAVCKGLIEQEDIPRTAAIVAGDKIEMAIYDHLTKKDPRYESNPLWVSEKYSTKNVKLIAHPDIVLKDDARKTLFVYEVKTTKYNINDTRTTYKSQLFIENTLAHEIISKLGSGWSVKLFLVHYSTEGLDLNDGVEFDPTRMTLKEVSFRSSALFDIKAAMELVDTFLETFTEYYDGDDVDADMLPVAVKSQFDDVAAMLVEIKEREAKVDEFKKRLYDFMVEKDIKSIKNDVFSITRVDPTESKTFDAKRYLDDEAKAHPRKVKKLVAKYTKVVKRNGFCQIKVKKDS